MFKKDQKVNHSIYQSNQIKSKCVLQRACGSVVGRGLLQEALDPPDPQQRLLPCGERPDHGHPGQLRLELKESSNKLERFEGDVQ